MISKELEAGRGSTTIEALLPNRHTRRKAGPQSQESHCAHQREDGPAAEGDQVNSWEHTGAVAGPLTTQESRMRAVTPAPQNPAPAPRPGGLLSRLREAIILLAGGGLTWTGD